MSYRGFRPYVSVAKRRSKGARRVAKLRKSGRKINPIEITGQIIARSFWGKAWCQNLEDYGDYENRLPRGRTYARNGSILDLQISKGRIDALVSGSDLYEVAIQIEPLTKHHWQAIRGECTGKIDSLVDLLAGSLADGVMEMVSRKGVGLFPLSQEIRFSCSCPDWADMCKHIAATLYGVGARLDDQPDMLFTLRDVDPADMIEEAITHGIKASEQVPRGRVLNTDDLTSVFGIDINFGDDPKTSAKSRQATSKATGKKNEYDLSSLPVSTIRIFETIKATPGLRRAALASKVGVSSSVIASGVAKLKARNLITFEGATRTGGYVATT